MTQLFRLLELPADTRRQLLDGRRALSIRAALASLGDASYGRAMEPRAGNCDTATMNPVDDPTVPVVAEEIELEPIDRGIDEAVRGEVVDARTFLEHLRDGDSNDEAAR